MDFTAERKAMVDSQVRVNDVTNHEIHMAMMAVPRERYCAPDRIFAAYSDASVEIAGDRKLMPARDVSKLLQAADAREGEKALAIAAPYAAAVLARMGLTVTAQESDAAVFEVVGEALAEDGVTTAEWRPCRKPGGRPCGPAAVWLWSSGVAPSARPPSMLRAAKACRVANCSIHPRPFSQN